jgi:ferredoxin
VTLHVRVDPIACKAHGLCAEVFPELIELDDWGYPIIRNGGVVPADREAYARLAADYCPTLALLLERKKEGKR